MHLILNGDYIYPCFVASLLSKVKLPKLVSRTNTCILYLLNTNSTEYKVWLSRKSLSAVQLPGAAPPSAAPAKSSTLLLSEDLKSVLMNFYCN